MRALYVLGLQVTVGIAVHFCHFLPGSELLVFLVLPATALYACGFRRQLRERYGLLARGHAEVRAVEIRKLEPLEA